MKLSFNGANYNVTGSRHILKVNGKQILLDCGLFQGARRKEIEYNRTFSFDPKEIDYVILSHAHIDHSGNLPNLVKNGFKGTIFTTDATKDLCELMLKDGAFIQEKDAEYLTEKRAKKGLPPVQPIYGIEDVEKTLPLFRGITYDTEFEICPGVKVVFREAGHILGSAITKLTIQDQETGATRKLAYTGDLGRKNLPILRNPHQIEEADYLIIEGTYGNRLHESIVDVEKRMEKIINDTARNGGKIIIPAFALGRTQEIVYTIHRLIQQEKIPALPIYVDSPLAVHVTDVFKSYAQYFDRDTRHYFTEKNEDPLGFGRLTYITEVEESKKLNNNNGPCIIISPSGMCEFGRIVHHLKNSIEDNRNTILIVGYQAENTLGRRLVEGLKTVKIFGKPYTVRAKIEIINAFSAHADRSDLLEFTKKILGLKKVFLVHGEEDQLMGLKENLIANSFKEDQIVIPHFGDEITLD